MVKDTTVDVAIDEWHTASYPSSVLMNAIPARVAGVERIAMAVPAPGGTLNPLVLAAADKTSREHGRNRRRWRRKRLHSVAQDGVQIRRRPAL